MSGCHRAPTQILCQKINHEKSLKDKNVTILHCIIPLFFTMMCLKENIDRSKNGGIFYDYE